MSGPCCGAISIAETPIIGFNAIIHLWYMESKKESEQKEPQQQKQATAQFLTKLPEKYQVPDATISLDTGMKTKDLNSVPSPKIIRRW